MKEAVILTFALALIGMGLFIFGASNGASSMELTGFLLTLPLTLIAAMGLVTIAVALVGVIAMALWQALVQALSWALAAAGLRRRRG